MLPLCYAARTYSANFSSANFSSANFSSANFSSAKFCSAKFRFSAGLKKKISFKKLLDQNQPIFEAKQNRTETRLVDLRMEKQTKKSDSSKVDN